MITPLPRHLPSALLGACVLTVVVTVGGDLASGNHPAHAAAIGAIAAVLGVARLRHAGRHRVLFGLLSALLVAQPVLHAADLLLGGAHGAPTDGAASLAYLVLSALVVTVVGVAEQLGETAGSTLRALLRLARFLLVAPPGERVALPRTPSAVVVRRRRTSVRYAVRRGPPVLRPA